MEPLAPQALSLEQELATCFPFRGQAHRLTRMQDGGALVTGCLSHAPSRSEWGRSVDECG